MRNFFNELLVQMKGIWSRLDGGQRLIVVAVLCATAVGLGGIVWYAGQPTYEVVFTATSKDDIAGAVRNLKAESGEGMVILGSGSIVSQLTQAGLIDAYQLVVNPVVLGGGKSMFAGLKDRATVRLTSLRPFKNGNVVLTYARA